MSNVYMIRVAHLYTAGAILDLLNNLVSELAIFGNAEETFHL